MTDESGAVFLIDDDPSVRDARAAGARRFERLTQREREILEFISAGHQNREIAAQLGISARTVEVHKARIMAKLECDSLAELIRIHRGGE